MALPGVLGAAVCFMVSLGSPGSWGQPSGLPGSWGRPSALWSPWGSCGWPSALLSPRSPGGQLSALWSPWGPQGPGGGCLVSQGPGSGHLLSGPPRGPVGGRLLSHLPGVLGGSSLLSGLLGVPGVLGKRLPALWSLGVPGVLGATVCSLVPPGLKEGADLDLEWRTWTPTPALRRVGGALGVQWGPVLRVSAPCPAPPG